MCPEEVESPQGEVRAGFYLTSIKQLHAATRRYTPLHTAYTLVCIMILLVITGALVNNPRLKTEVSAPIFYEKFRGYQQA